MILSRFGRLTFQGFLGGYLALFYYSYYRVAADIVGGHQFDSSVVQIKVLFDIFNSSSHNKAFFLSMLLVAFGIFFNFLTRYACLFAFYGWLSIVNCFPYVNPSDAYVGWLILAVALFPTSDGPEKFKRLIGESLEFFAALVLGVSMLLSGVDKLKSPSWINGSSFEFVMSSPIARFDLAPNFFEMGWGVLGLLAQLVTYMVLFVEMFFLPLFLFPSTRKWAWILSFLWNLVGFFLLQIPVISAGMLLFHLFIMRPEWWSIGSSKRTSDHDSEILVNLAKRN